MRTRGVLSGLSGAITAGLVVLAIGVAVTQYLGNTRGFPGPGAVSVVVHIVGAIVAIVAQRIADHRTGVGSALASLTVFAVTAAVLWTQWYN